MKTCVHKDGLRLMANVRNATRIVLHAVHCLHRHVRNVQTILLIWLTVVASVNVQLDLK